MRPFLLLKKLVIATHNEGKVREFAALLDLPGVEAVSAASLSLAEPEENGASFAENAAIKARAAAKASGLPALADDSGLSVDALDGAPGIYSARWMKPGAGPVVRSTEASRQTSAVAVAPVSSEMGAEQSRQNTGFTKIETLLREKGVTPDGARAAFVCVLALAMPEGEILYAEGRVEGRLCFPPRGEGGFGYDPIFIAEGKTQSFAEMPAAEKHALSHRGRAVEALKQMLK